MSHTTTIDLVIKDEGCFAQACKDLGYPITQNTTVRLYDGSVYENATSVQLPNWRYPVVVKDGKVFYDTYNGSWGKEHHLDSLRQRYARNVTVSEAKKKGYRVHEKKDADGQVKLTLTR